MRLSKRQIAVQVDRLVALRRRLASMQLRADTLSLQLLKVGGGESSSYVAKVVRMPRKVVVVKAHAQLRTYRKPARGDGG